MTRDVTAEYRAFVAAMPVSDDGYLFERPQCRFWPEATDELVAAPGARAARVDEGVAVALPNGARLPVRGLSFEQLRAGLSVLPARYSRLTIELGAHTGALIEQAFSKVIFAPAALAALDARLSGSEIVRFPGSPYEIVRSYWKNSCDVRDLLEQHGVPTGVADFRALLLQLHERLLLGSVSDPEARRSFYLPASALGRKRPAPGTFYEPETSVERRGGEWIIQSGLRVSAPLLGGDHYWRLLAESVSDLGALDDERDSLRDGLDWGRVLRGRTEDEQGAARPWFLPPRPLTSAHFETLLTELQRAEVAVDRRDVGAALRALGAFHHGFVRLHPLPSGNQSLSMNIVNWLLRRTLGAGIPHLLLDQLALRFELAAYQQLFARAAQAWAWPDAQGPGGEAASPAARLRRLMHLRRELDTFVSELGAVGSLIEARGRVAENLAGARLALIASP